MMRIAVTVDPYIPVPPTEYGGIERTVDYMCRGLLEKGHQVTLFAHPESQVSAALIPYGKPPHLGIVNRIRELQQLGEGLWRRRKEFDIVINWGRLAALLPLLPIRSLPKIQRYCRGEVPWRSVRIATKIAGDSIVFAGASESVYSESGKVKAGEWETVYDGVELDRYSFVPTVPSNAPLVFVGRVCPVKGPHTAIAVAKATQRKLIIAGNREATTDDPTYFERAIEPHLDGHLISYIGPVNDQQKNQLLGQAAALLFPTAFKEAFGIVMAEAMACGTPVIGSGEGSVPEVIDDGKTGFVCHSLADYIEAVRGVSFLDRGVVRRTCEMRFNSHQIVDQVEALCRRLIRRTCK